MPKAINSASLADIRIIIIDYTIYSKNLPWTLCWSGAEGLGALGYRGRRRVQFPVKSKTFFQRDFFRGIFLHRALDLGVLALALDLGVLALALDLGVLALALALDLGVLALALDLGVSALALALSIVLFLARYRRGTGFTQPLTKFLSPFYFK
jgi:hypothetical protein